MSGIPQGPAYANIDQNVSQARAYASSHSLPERLFWFYEKVRNGGDWDYKQDKTADYEAFGNFQYGVTGRDMGFSEDFLRRMAGWAQTRARTSGKYWDVPWGRAPYGDDPMDQVEIDRGFHYFRENFPDFDSSLPAPGPELPFDPSRDSDKKGGNNDGFGAPGGPGDGGGRSGADGTEPPRRDPLVLDLDGDGIETTSTRDGTVILFDHDADGVKTGTSWVKPDDGWLVLDRNGNGIIDSGRELFGVDTFKSNGQFAFDGFDALKDLDANQDGKIDATDSVFANLALWRDLNQDGISQANELSTLTANSITSIGVNASAVNTDLGNGNVQTAAGTFTRSNGTTGTTGETNGAAANLDLLVNTFYRTFTTQIPLTDQAKALPTLRGSGRVRDLNEAISLSTDLGNWVHTYTQQTTRQGQIDKLDGFIEKWADTADLKSLKNQVDFKRSEKLDILAHHEIQPEHKAKLSEGFEPANCSSVQKTSVTNIEARNGVALRMGVVAS